MCPSMCCSSTQEMRLCPPNTILFMLVDRCLCAHMLDGRVDMSQPLKVLGKELERKTDQRLAIREAANLERVHLLRIERCWKSYLPLLRCLICRGQEVESTRSALGFCWTPYRGNFETLTIACSTGTQWEVAGCGCKVRIVCEYLQKNNLSEFVYDWE